MKYYFPGLLIFFLSCHLQAQEDLSLDWFTYLGGNSVDNTLAVETTSQGEVILAGYTSSTSGLATSTGWQTSYGGGLDDGFISKWSSEGNLLWATYLGGEGFDHVQDIAISENGDIVAVGFTTSTTGIATVGAYQTEKANINNAGFISKYSPNGQLLWSTYLAGSITDDIGAVAMDSNGQIYLAGITASPDMATLNAFQTEIGFQTDGFITKFSAEGNLSWYTYYGGADEDQIYDLEINNTSELFFLGYTRGSTGLASENAEQETGIEYSLLLGKFDSNGQRIWSTYIDGEGDERFGSLAISDNNEIIIAGRTSSLTGISTSGAFMETNTETGFAQFIAKYSNDGNKIWCTYLGLPNSILGIGDIRYMTSSIYYAFVTGENNQDLVIGQNPFQSVFNNGVGGSTDVILMKLTNNGMPIWGTYFGGTEGESATSFIVPLNSGNQLLVAGSTNSTDFYASQNSWQATIAGPSDCFLAKLSDLTISLRSEIDERTDISFFPNPSNGSFTLNWDESFGDYGDLIVVNNIGQIVYESEIRSFTKIELNLASGFYNVRLQQNGKSYSRKIIIN